MSNVLNRAKQEQIRALGRLGWSLRRIGEELGVRRETASRYLKEAGIEVRAPGQRRLPEAKPASHSTTDHGGCSKPASQSTADSGGRSKPASQPTTDLERSLGSFAGRSSACEPYRETISEALDRGRHAHAIWQDLVDDHGFGASYESVKRFCRKLRGERKREAHPTIQTAPGEEGQVDYGDGPMVRDPKTGKYRRTRLFAMTLGYSRKAVWLLCFKSSSQKWSELHEEAFRRLGGAPRTIVLDNLKEGVIKPDVYDAELNPLYKDVLAHYGVVALPARVRHPDRKGKVERSVEHAQGKLRGLRFESLEEAQAYLDRWSERWADTRIHGTTKRQVAQMFAEEKPSLSALPVEPFRYYHYGERTVHLDGCIEVEAAYYGAPHGWIGKRVNVQWNDRWVRMIDPKTGELLREHRTKPRGWRTVHPSDAPKKTPPSTLNLLAQARRSGQSIGALCEEIHKRNEEAGVRRILGVLSLVKKHGTALVDQACAEALEIGAPQYRFVRRWIERYPPAALTLKQVDPLIRELTQYRDRIEELTRTQKSNNA